MPCYSNWMEALPKGSPQYARKRALLEKDLNILHRMIRFYYAVNAVEIPEVVGHAPRFSSEEATPELQSLKLTIRPGEISWKIRGHAKSEDRVLRQITLHLLCDGIGWEVLYDMYSIVNLQSDHLRLKRVINLLCHSLRDKFLSLIKHPAMEHSGIVARNRKQPVTFAPTLD